MSEITQKEAELYGTEAEEAEGTSSTYSHYFQEPWTFGGKEYTVLNFDMGSLTGKDSLEIENDLLKQGIRLVSPESSASFADELALHACPELTKLAQKELPIVEFYGIREAMREFLMRLWNNAKTGEDGVYTVKLSAPVQIHGKDVEEVTFAPNRLTGSDALAITRKSGSAFEATPVGEKMTLRFQTEAAARCYLENGKRVRIQSKELEALPILDFHAVCGRIRGFFANSGLGLLS